MLKIRKYWKTVVAAVAAGAITANELLADDALTTSEGVTTALAILGALGVYTARNAD
ncbi:hypothetical protein [Actinomadura madurae]|uniref:hypothetical protein n=1 Tax=Actinomadura madurae TaxID=1993 RepID=UPI0020D23B91|nr:hypothetical protein [Actinomadura madurae]MCP9947296.1 hypothetical protein [Actinomadura madurae]MCP9964057.1 hypothetical protein [Actinomadura madurae]MCP9976531.1 hypothetical protein [Actinomadura madurae]MCQ0011971.1 hypothetical protein [Actinomadura madurae]